MTWLSWLVFLAAIFAVGSNGFYLVRKPDGVKWYLRFFHALAFSYVGMLYLLLGWNISIIPCLRYSSGQGYSFSCSCWRRSPSRTIGGNHHDWWGNCGNHYRDRRRVDRRIRGIHFYRDFASSSQKRQSRFAFPDG